ncbi:hypothetical protein ACLOJK_040693 [Asimina triloba]
MHSDTSFLAAEGDSSVQTPIPVFHHSKTERKRQKQRLSQNRDRARLGSVAQPPSSFAICEMTMELCKLGETMGRVIRSTYGNTGEIQRERETEGD